MPPIGNSDSARPHMSYENPHCSRSMRFVPQHILQATEVKRQTESVWQAHDGNEDTDGHREERAKLDDETQFH